MAGKILIFGATGAVGSSLAKLLSDSSKEIHLIGKNEEEVATKHMSFSVENGPRRTGTHAGAIRHA